MAIDLPVNAPLTSSQGELTSKIGSMKSLLALPDILKKNIPKDNQISAYDYLLKVLSTIGLNPDLIFNSFLTLVFNQAGTFLEDSVISALAKSIGHKGIQISPHINNPTPTSKEIKTYQANNISYFHTILPNNFLNVVKQDLAKKLALMIFGRNQPLEASLSTPLSPAEADALVGSAICAEGMFSLSNPPIVRNEDIEYNKIALKKQIEKGQIVYSISCQGVKITLPANPTFIFDGGGPFTSPSSVVSPAESLIELVQYVNNQIQRINNETNANQGGKNFHQTLIEKLLSYIPSIVQPYLSVLLNIINTAMLSMPSPPSVPYQAQDFGVYDNCDISNDPTNTNKKTFSTSLFNALLKELLKLLLLFGIKKFKNLVATYFAKHSLEKQRRKLQKAELKFQTFFGKASAQLDKVKKYEAALITLNGVLQV